MEVLEDLGFGVLQNNSILFDKKSRSHYFYIEYNKKFKKTAVVALLSKNL
jgi:hypothetical protein